MKPEFTKDGRELTIELAGKDALHVGSFIEVVSSTLSALSAIARRLGVQDGFRDWSVVALSKNSPGKLTLAAPTRERAAESRPVVDALLDGVNRLNVSAEPPPYFDEVVMGKLLRIVRPLNNGLATIKFSTQQKAVAPTLHIAANINTIDQRENPTHRAWTVLDGWLEAVTVHGKYPKFTIYDTITGGGTECYFDEGDLDEVRAALAVRVEVYGLAKYTSRPTPVSIDVDSGSLRTIPASVPQFGEFKIDVAPGEDAATYIDRMREEDD